MHVSELRNSNESRQAECVPTLNQNQEINVNVGAHSL